ncbi:MAG: hypothetical protein AB1633_00785 [Elusimicrobiota bacterium]
MSNAFELRQNGDYEPLPEIDEDKSKKVLSEAKDFLEAARKYLERIK